MNDYIIRMATEEDAEAILAIYEPYILNTAITFEYETISVATMKERIETVQKQLPWLVYEVGGKVLGYAYCAKFKERAAFSWDCECSVYIEEKEHRRGIATALYTKLFELVQKQGYYTIYALITYSHESSIALHRKFGFTEVGIYQKTGYKMGQWWDLLVMEKRIHNLEVLPKQQPSSIHDILP